MPEQSTKSNRSQDQANFVSWFRNSSPYIHAHRNRTFVMAFAGEAVQESSFSDIIHDIALLNSLGVQLVLVHGIRPQIDQRLQSKGETPAFNKHMRITDDTALQCVKEAAGLVRVEIEAQLSMGLANSPMSGALIRVISGNFITARPLGVIDGIDYCHTGEIRRIDSAGIKQQLLQNHIVLISPTGYSPSGETFNLVAEQVATEIAIAIKAEKLIFLTERKCNIAQFTTDEAQTFLSHNPELAPELKNPLSAAVKAVTAGVQRVHLIDRKLDGSLLLELFSRNGVGTLISANTFETLRSATLNDIGGILELIAPLEEQGKLIKRSRERLEIDINDYFVVDIDGMIIACAAMHQLEDSNSGEIACVAVHPDYRNAARGELLLQHIYDKAADTGINKLFVLSTQTMHWFIEKGFQPTIIDNLPASLKTIYNPQRNSKVLFKIIE